jgi:hypothetical protein
VSWLQATTLLERTACWGQAPRRGTDTLHVKNKKVQVGASSPNFGKFQKNGNHIDFKEKE